MRNDPTPMPGDLARAPFSNSDHGEWFLGHVCAGQCVHDSSYGAEDEWGDEIHCPLITLALIGVTPREWLTDPNEPREARGCSEFTTETEAREPTPVAVDLFGVFAHEPRSSS